MSLTELFCDVDDFLQGLSTHLGTKATRRRFKKAVAKNLIMDQRNNDDVERGRTSIFLPGQLCLSITDARFK